MFKFNTINIAIIIASNIDINSNVNINMILTIFYNCILHYLQFVVKSYYDILYDLPY